MFKNNVKLSDKIIFYIYQGLIIIMPLFFLPWTSSRLGMDNFNKQFLLWLIVPILFFWQIWQRYYQKQEVSKKSPFFLPIIFLAIVMFLSAVASVDKFSSFWGGQATTVQPFFTFIIFILFYLFSITFLDSKEKITAVIKSLIISYWVIILGAVLIFSGALSHSVIFTDYFKLAAGSLEELSIYISLVCSLQLVILLGNNFQFCVNLEKWQRVVIKISLLLSLPFLLVANFTAAWLVLFFSIVSFITVLLAIKSKKDKEDIFDQYFFKKIFWSLIFLVLSGVFLIINYFYIDPAATDRRFAQNLRLDYANTRHIALESLKHKPVVGSGLETFSFAHSLWHDNNFNYSAFWNLRFDKSPSYFLEIIITSGTLGLLGWLSFVGVLIYLVYKLLAGNKKFAKIDDQDLFLVFLSASLGLGLIFGQIFFAVNTVLLFLFWLVLSLFTVSYSKIFDQEKKLSAIINFFARSNKFKNNFFIALMFVCFFGWLIFIGFGARYWIANLFYSKGMNAAIVDDSRAIVDIKKAAALNPHRYEYDITLSKLYLNKGLDDLKNQTDNSVNLVEVRSMFEQSINWGQQAIKTGDKSVVAYENLSKVYRDVGSYLATANNLAIESLIMAASLEPTNPVLFTEMGKIYFSIGQTEKAAEAYEKSLALKNDYSDAKFNLAKAKDEQGKYDEALALLDDLEDRYDAASVFYEEGRIFYNQRRYDAAIEEFKKVIGISPNHANALYSLAVAFQATGEKQEALYYFKKVAQLNPDSQEIKKKIEELEK